jgi:hypothetical protein
VRSRAASHSARERGALATAETPEERAKIGAAQAGYYSARLPSATPANAPEPIVEKLQDWVQVAEATGGEVGLTVLVSGVLVTGMLTPWPRYAAWSKEVTMRGMHETGPQALPDIPMGPISPEQAERARADYAAELSESGFDADETPEFPQFAMRDVTIRTGAGATWVRVPYLVVDTASVSAFFLGLVGPMESLSPK